MNAILYSLYLIRRRQKQEVGSVLLITAALCVSCAVLLTVCNLVFSVRKTSDALASRMDTYRVSANIADSYAKTFSYAIYEDRFMAAQAEESDAPFPLLETYVQPAATVDKLPINLTVVCAPEVHGAVSSAKDTVFAAEPLYSAIRNGTLRLFLSCPVEVCADGIVLGGVTYRLACFSDLPADAVYHRRSDPIYDLPISELLLFPSDAAHHFSEEAFVSYQLKTEAKGTHIADAYHTLYRYFGDMVLHIDDPGAALAKRVQELTMYGSSAALCALLLLVVTVVGSVGVTLILLYRRKRDTAIAYALGCTVSRQRTEFFIEIAGLYAVGGGMGMLLSVWLTKKLAAARLFSVVLLTVHAEGLLLAIPAIPLLAFLTICPALAGYRNTIRSQLQNGGL